MVEHEDQENIGKPRVIKLKEDKALNLLSDDEFPGFLFVKVSLFAVNPPPRPPLERNIKTEEWIYLNDFHFKCAFFFPKAMSCGSIYILDEICPQRTRKELRTRLLLCGAQDNSPKAR